ncbi:hypothetical protein ACFYS8_26835 [Kitasatospora sp. NPDC004615]|uniref:hypothetical protein n=1 Tax=Kitasatospora sp. NPDC004615 TaxID=3364017 RepID=UPI0036774BAD
MGLSLDALDAVEWAGLETASRSDPVETVPRTLRRLAQAGAAATEEDCRPLYCLRPQPPRQLPSAAPVAAPFLLALALDPDLGARPALVELLCHILELPGLLAQHRASARSLLADPDPVVRRVAAPLAPDCGVLLERWRAEPERMVRVALLRALEERPDAEDAPAVLAEALAGEDPALYVAAVLAGAVADPDLPVRHFERLIAVLSDPALRPRFADLWYLPDVEEPCEREHLLWWVFRLFAHRPDLESAYPVRLLAAAEQNGDLGLCQEALDLAWSLLTRRRCTAPELPTAVGPLLDHPSPAVRLRAANLLAGLGPAATPWADRLTALLDDDNTDPRLDGTVGELARWALLRTGDPRGLPGLAAQLLAQEEEGGRCYVTAAPHRPDVADVLAPLRAHADTLLPEVCEVLRRTAESAFAARGFLTALTAWGPDAAPVLPELPPLLDHPYTAYWAQSLLAAIGPAAAPLARTRALTDLQLHWHPDLIADDRPTALRLIGEAVLNAVPPLYGPIDRLAEFGPAAAAYTDHLHHLMATAEPRTRAAAAAALWSITARPEPCLDLLAGHILATADGDDQYGLLAQALRTLIRMNTITSAIRTALLTIHRTDHRLSHEQGCTAILRDEELRALIDRALACPDAT